MQLINRNAIGQRIGGGASALNSGAADALSLISGGGNLADLVRQVATPPAAQVAAKTPQTLSPNTSVRPAAQTGTPKKQVVGYNEMKQKQLVADKLKQAADTLNRNKVAASGKAGVGNGNTTGGIQGGGNEVDDGGAGAKAAVSMGGKLATGTVAGILAGASPMDAVGMATKGVLNPVSMGITLGNLLSNQYTGYGMLDNLAAAVQDATGVDLNKWSGGFLTPNPQGPLGNAKTTSPAFGVTGFDGGNSSTRAEMASNTPNVVSGTYSPGNPVLAGLTAEQVSAQQAQAAADAKAAAAKAAADAEAAQNAAAVEAAKQTQQAKLNAIINKAIATTASTSQQGGTFGGVSQTSSSAMSNPNNTQSPAVAGGHSGYQGGGGGMGYGGGNSTSNSGSNGTGRGGGNYSGGGHSGAGGIGA